MWEIQLHVIQKLIAHDPHLQRCPHHSSKELRDISRVVSHRKGHHGFGSGTIPPCGKCLLKENHFNLVIVRDFGRLDMGDGQSIQFQSCPFSKAVGNFSMFEWCTDLFFNFCKHIFQVGVRQRAVMTLAHLNHKHRIYIGIVLLRRVLIPALAFLQPFFHSSFQKYNIVVFFRIFRVSNDNPILEKARATNIIRRTIITYRENGNTTIYLIYCKSIHFVWNCVAHFYNLMAFSVNIYWIELKWT